MIESWWVAGRGGREREERKEGERGRQDMKQESKVFERGNGFCIPSMIQGKNE